MNEEKGVNAMKRRKFIKVMGVGAASVILGGCGLNAPLTTKVSENTPLSNENVNENLPKFTGTVEYRTMPRTGGEISTVGLGAGGLHESSPSQIEDMIAYACDSGINFMDTAMSNFSPAEAVGRALKGRRDKMVTQMHIGIIYPNPNQVYTRTRDLSKVQQGFEQQLKGFGTDYSDIGMLHYVDAADDLQRILSDGIFDYAQKLKQDGTVRYLGVSTHSVDICQRFLEMDEIDVIMLSTNAAYDFVPSNGKLDISQERRQLYQDCEKKGVAITVMKPFGGGRLLDAGTSPFGRAMSIPQCIQYALDRPATISCVPGVRNMDDLASVLAYYNTSREERDYAFIADAQQQDMDGVCIYCNHCLPCPVNIDIGAVNKYLDLANSGDALAKDHYFKLARKASACTFCGVCEPRCPFHVHVRERMEQAIQFLGE